MKIKIWAFVLIIVGSLVLGGALGFVTTGGLNAAGKMLEYMRPQINASAQVPNTNNSNGNYGGNYYGMMPGYGQYSTVPEKPSGLPQDFNAGVNIESEYGLLTNRTAEQVQAAEQSANADVWGLAQSEGKLDQLKQKVTDDVTASLKQMVTDGKITQAQSDSYLTWVEQYLQVVGQQAGYSMMPGYGRGMMPGFGRHNRGGNPQQTAPAATPAPTATGSGV